MTAPTVSVHEPQAPPSFAARPVYLVAGVVAVLLVIVSAFSDSPFDELYFIAIGGDHLDWSFADQPPLVPLLAAAMHAIAPGSSLVLRLLAALAAGGAVIVGAQLARELGGARRAQLLTAITMALAFGRYVPGRWLVTYTVDPLWWTLLAWLLARWVRTRQDRLLVAAGLVTALSLQTKFLVLLFWAVIGVAVLVAGPRDLLRRPLLWVAAAGAAVTALPGVIWQAANGWPQVQMGSVVAAEVDRGGGRLALLFQLLVVSGSVVGIALCLYGGWRLLRAESLRPYRFLGLAVIGVAIALIVMQGRGYYAMGIIAPLIAAGAVEVTKGKAAAWWRWLTSVPVIALSAVFVAVVMVASAVPAMPLANTVLPAKPLPLGTWDRYANEVGQYVRAAPPSTTVVVSNYAQAAALELHGPDHGVPAVYSSHRGYWYFGAPPETSVNAIIIGADVDRLRPYFTEVHQLGTVHQVTNDPVWLATGRTQPWQQFWPSLRHL
jgi:4-amino-4-deoxy-L-arabinose transferase-like glycosyltransferase